MGSRRPVIPRNHHRAVLEEGDASCRHWPRSWHAANVSPMWAGTTPLFRVSSAGPCPGPSPRCFSAYRDLSLYEIDWLRRRRSHSANLEYSVMACGYCYGYGYCCTASSCLSVFGGGLLHRHHHHHHTAEKRWACDERSSMKFQYYLALADRMRRRGGVIRWGPIERSGSKPVSVPPDRLFFSSSI